MKLYKNIKPEFTDDRGEIFMIFDDGKTSINSILMITSKKGAIRANHYHKEDAHYCYMVSGKMEYTEELVEGGKRETVTVEAGDMVYTPPMTKHAMRFLEDSSLWAFSTKSRQEGFGKKEGAYEMDTVRVKLI